MTGAMMMGEATAAEQRSDHHGHGHGHMNEVGYAHDRMMMRKRRINADGAGAGGSRSRTRRSGRNNMERASGDGRVMAPPTALQELFTSCKDVFRGPGTVPAPCDVQKLCRILDEMKPQDVGLSSKLQLFSAKDLGKGTLPIVTSTTIYKCQNFSLCLFFLPPTAVIPLHNHPGMTVFSKLLLGTMHIKSYDWVDPVTSSSNNHSAQSRLAKLISNSDFTAPCNTSVLYPTTGGNIHEFTAITTCAVLDVLGPPYSNDDGRDCSYYKELPSSVLSAVPNGGNSEMKEDECCRWLQEIDVPENSQMDEIEYLGPQIIHS